MPVSNFKSLPVNVFESLSILSFIDVASESEVTLPYCTSYRLPFTPTMLPLFTLPVETASHDIVKIANIIINTKLKIFLFI